MAAWSFFNGVKPDRAQIRPGDFEVVIANRTDGSVTVSYETSEPYIYSGVNCGANLMYRLGTANAKAGSLNAQPERTIKTPRGVLPLSWKVDIEVNLYHQYNPSDVENDLIVTKRDEIMRTDCVVFLIEPHYLASIADAKTLSGLDSNINPLPCMKVIDFAQVTFSERIIKGGSNIILCRITKRAMPHPYRGFEYYEVSM